MENESVLISVVFNATPGMEATSDGLFARIELVASVVFGTIGMLGAVLVVLAYNFRNNPTPSEVMITTLSCVDFCYNCFNMLFVIMQCIGEMKTWQVSGSFFLFGFTITSSFLLIWLITVNRYYAICRAVEYKATFTPERCRRSIRLIIAIALTQATLNGVYPLVPESVQKLIDFEFYLAMDLMVSVASALMTFVYIRVLLTLREQKERRARRQAQAAPRELQVANKGSNEATPEPSTSLRPPVPTSAPTQNGTVAGRRSAAAAAGNSTERVTFTLFIISVMYMLLVSPFILCENVVFLSGHVRGWLGLVDGGGGGSDWLMPGQARITCRIMFLLNFLVNPVIYQCTSRIFRARTRKLLIECSPSVFGRILAAPSSGDIRSSPRKSNHAQLTSNV